MSLVCSLTGEACVEAVVTKNGDVYERRAIEKYIASTGTDPITKEPLTVADLIPIKALPNPAATRPRTGAQHSMSGLLAAFQNEWDAVMLECFNLKQQLLTTRQELNQVKYQHDAARRVIARLLKERDQLQQELNNLRAHSIPRPADQMDVEASLPGLSAEMKAKIQQTSKELMHARQSRQISPTLTARATIQQFKQVGSVPPHKSTVPGVLCLDLIPHPDKEHLVITGGADATAVIYNRQTEKKEATLAEHRGPVIATKFHHKLDNIVLTASEDKTAKTWKYDAGLSKWNCSSTFGIHTDAITGMDLHVTGDFIVTSSMDRSWALHDINTGVSLTKVIGPDVDLGLTTVQFHPDGAILATGGVDFQVRAWEIRSNKQMAVFEGHKGKITSVCFNENGYYFATAAEDKVIKLWDLRYLKLLASVTLEDVCNALAYDQSGRYLAAAVGSEIRVFTRTTQKEQDKTQTVHFDFVQAFDDHTKIVTGVKWGHDARFIASTSMDRTLKFFSSQV